MLRAFFLSCVIACPTWALATPLGPPMHCVPVERHADVVKTLTDQGAKLTEYAGDRLAKLVADFNSAPPQTDFEATSMETYEADGTTLVFLIDDSSMCEVYSGSTDAWRHVLDRVFGPGA